MELQVCDGFVIPGAIENAFGSNMGLRAFKTSVAVGLFAALLLGKAPARDDGRYANSPLKPWFDRSWRPGEFEAMK